jgi:hypothetical protein
MIWVRAVQLSTNTGPSIFIKFADAMNVNIGFCTEKDPRPKFILPDTYTYRIWTFRRDQKSIHIFCNGKEVINFALADSKSEKCVEKWSHDFPRIRFSGSSGEEDTASDSFRQLPMGKLF